AACTPARSALPADESAAAAASSGAAVAAPDSATTPVSARAGATGERPAEQVQVLPGLEVLLRDSAHLLRGRRVGFLTNQTAVTSTGQSGIDLLHEIGRAHVVALFGPEHGLRGGVEGGVKIESGADAERK